MILTSMTQAQVDKLEQTFVRAGTKGGEVVWTIPLWLRGLRHAVSGQPKGGKWGRKSWNGRKG